MMGWKRATKHQAAISTDQPFVSVVVPVRNEASTIEHLLHDLAKQTYPHFEIIIVDDSSEDTTLNVILSVREKSPQLKKQLIILTSSDQTGKKAALALGIQHAKGEIILTTDADCRVNREWIQSTVAQFSKTTKMVIGGVRLSTTTFFTKLQQLEFASLIGSGAATLGWGLPSMANGANLAFRKTAFLNVGGYAGNEHIASGDDEFLLRKIHQAYPATVQFNNQQESVVETAPQPTLSDFFQQRLRWAGKWALHSGLFSKVLAVSVFLFQGCFLLVPWLVLAGNFNFVTGLGLIAVKVVVEFLFFRSVTRYQGITFSWPAFITLQFIYPAYVVVVALFTNLIGYSWKGRNF